CSGRSTDRIRPPGPAGWQAGRGMLLSVAYGLTFRTAETSLPRQELGRILPESLQSVERPGLGVEEVDHHVDEVEQDPASGGQTLDVECGVTGLFQRADHPVSDAADVGVGCT